MPRTPNTTTPQYRKHRASGQAIVTFNGRDYYLGLFGTKASRLEYDRLISEWLASGRQLLNSSPSLQISIVELMAQYIRYCGEYYSGSPGEIERVKIALRPLKTLYGHCQAEEFGPRSLEAVRRSMIGNDLSMRTINQRIERIKRLFRWAVKSELISPEVWHGLQALEGLRRGQLGVRPPKTIKPVPDKVVDEVIPHLLPPVAAMVQIQRLTGMRPGEVVIMRGCDLDTTGTLWAYSPPYHKTQHHGHERKVYLGPLAQEVLKPFLKSEISEYLFSPAEAMKSRYARIRAARLSQVQPSQISRAKKRPRRKPGNCYDVASYRRAIERGCDRAFPVPVGLSDVEIKDWRNAHRWHPHQLRHNAATRLRKEFGLDAARLILGHRSAAVTETYAEVDQSRAAEVMARVG